MILSYVSLLGHFSWSFLNWWRQAPHHTRLILLYMANLTDVSNCSHGDSVTSKYPSSRINVLSSISAHNTLCVCVWSQKQCDMMIFIFSVVKAKRPSLLTFQVSRYCRLVCGAVKIRRFYVRKPANTTFWLYYSVLMLGQRRRRWFSIKTAYGQCLFFCWEISIDDAWPFRLLLLTNLGENIWKNITSSLFFVFVFCCQTLVILLSHWIY